MWPRLLHPWIALGALAWVWPPSSLAAISSLQLSAPRQCEPIVFAWTSSSSVAQGPSTAYQLVIVPLETRQSLRNYSFSSTSNRYVLPELAVPKNVSFVALLQDSDGPDHGRVSQVVTSGEPVQAGSDCLRQVVAEDGVFFVDPSTPTTCGCSFGWSEAAMDPIGITGLIPGGVSFNVPVNDPGKRNTTSPFRLAPGSQVLFAVSDAGGGTRSGTLGFSPPYKIPADAAPCKGQGTEYAQPASTSMVFATLTDSVTRSLSRSASASASSAPSTNDGDTHTGSVIAGVLAAFAIIGAAAGFVWFCIRRRKRARKGIHRRSGTVDAPLLADPETVSSSSSYRPMPVYFDAAAHHELSPPPSSSYFTGTFPPGPNQPVSPGRSERSLGASVGGGGGGPSETSHGRASEVSEVERELKRTSIGPSIGQGSSSGRQDVGEMVHLLGPTGERLGEEDSRLWSRTRFVRHEDAGGLGGSGSTEEAELVVDLPPLYQDAHLRARPTPPPTHHPLAAPTPDKLPSSSSSAAVPPHPLADPDPPSPPPS